MSYRQFTLTNSEGAVWNLQGSSVKSFLNAPENLGFGNTISYIRYGEAGNVSSEEYEFPTPTGTIVFWDNANTSRYQQYHDFTRFLSHTPLTLSYIVPLSTPETYTLKCYPVSISKSESNGNILECEIAFQGLGFWKGTTVTVTGTSATTYTLTNNGDSPIGFEITISGTLENPYFTLEQDGAVYGEAKFIDSTAFGSVYISSNDGEQNIVLQQGGAIVPNPLSYQDLSISNGSIYVTFMKLARGESTLTIGGDSISLTNTTIVFTPIYRSV